MNEKQEWEDGTLTVGACPICSRRLYAEVSADGSAWECDRCENCDASWWHQIPKAPPQSPADMG